MICELDANGYCARHERVHDATERPYALEEGDRGEAFRRGWDALLHAAKNPPPPRPVADLFVVHTRDVTNHVPVPVDPASLTQGSPAAAGPQIVFRGVDPTTQAVAATTAPATPATGPGTELHSLLASLGITPAPGCDCAAKMAQMNTWGVAGCRANRWTIIGWLKDGAPRWSWLDQLKAAANALRTGLAFKLDWTDPFPGLVDEAIKRASNGNGK